MTWLLCVLVCVHEVLKVLHRHCSHVYDVYVHETNEYVTASVLSGPKRQKSRGGSAINGLMDFCT